MNPVTNTDVARHSGTSHSHLGTRQAARVSSPASASTKSTGAVLISNSAGVSGTSVSRRLPTAKRVSPRLSMRMVFQ
jgi:hypothetical protein